MNRLCFYMRFASVFMVGIVAKSSVALRKFWFISFGCVGGMVVAPWVPQPE